MQQAGNGVPDPSDFYERHRRLVAAIAVTASTSMGSVPGSITTVGATLTVSSNPSSFGSRFSVLTSAPCKRQAGKAEPDKSEGVGFRHGVGRSGVVLYDEAADRRVCR